MEDLSGASDDQIGAVVRDVQAKAREALMRELALEPVIDGVEGTYTATEGLAKDGYRLVGNVPPSGKAPGGMLRHRGWKTKAGKIVAPAELEIE